MKSKRVDFFITKYQTIFEFHYTENADFASHFSRIKIQINYLKAVWI